MGIMKDKGKIVLICGNASVGSVSASNNISKMKGKVFDTIDQFEQALELYIDFNPVNIKKDLKNDFMSYISKGLVEKKIFFFSGKVDHLVTIAKFTRTS